MKIHLAVKGAPICGCHKRWKSCNVTTTTNRDRVTCKRCVRFLTPNNPLSEKLRGLSGFGLSLVLTSVEVKIMHCHWCGTEAFTLPEKRLDDGMGGVYCSQECVDKADAEYKPLVERGQAIVDNILLSQDVGWNAALTWAAEWIETSAEDEPHARTQEFAANMAMSIRAAQRDLPDDEPAGIGVIE